ncbi:MAG: DNA-binding protein [Pseudobdellovibrio sp.]
MPEKKTIKRARADKKRGLAASTQAGEFVKEEMDHIRKGKHGAKSTKQAVAIGLSKARSAGVKLKPARGAKKQAAPSRSTSKKPSRRRSQAALKVLKREPQTAASHESISREVTASAKKRGAESRHQAAMKAAGTKKTSARKTIHNRTDYRGR